MRIRNLQSGDEPALWEVFYTAIHTTASADYTTEQLDAWAPLGINFDKWESRMQGMAPFVVEDDHEKLIAYANVHPSGYIDHFFVSPTVGRKGIGSMLMEKILETAASRGTESLFADVSLNAKPFFEKWGFMTETLQTVSIRGVNLVNAKMRKAL